MLHLFQILQPPQARHAGTPPVPDPQVEIASDEEPDQPWLSDIEQALTAAEKQKTTIGNGVKTAEYLIGRL